MIANLAGLGQRTRARNLDPVALTVIDGECDDFAALLLREGQAGRGVHAPREQYDGTHGEDVNPSGAFGHGEARQQPQLGLELTLLARLDHFDGVVLGAERARHSLV